MKWGKITQTTNIERPWGHGIIADNVGVGQYSFKLEQCYGTIDKGVKETKTIEAKDLKLGMLVAFESDGAGRVRQVYLSNKKGGF